MTGPVPLGGFQRRRRLFDPLEGLDDRRYDEAQAFGDETDVVDRAVGAGAPPMQPQQPQGGILSRILQAAPSAIARSFASNLDPQGGGLERFLGGMGRGFVDVQDQQAEQAETARQDEEDRSIREGRGQRLKMDLLESTIRQRELEQRNRPEVFAPETDPAFQRHRATRDYDIANPMPGQQARPIRPEWEEEGFPDQASYLRWLRQKTAATDRDSGGGGAIRATPGSPEHRQAWILARVREMGKPDVYGERPSVEEAEQRAVQEYERAYPPPPPAAERPIRSGWKGPRRPSAGFSAPAAATPPPAAPAAAAGDPAATQRQFWDAAAAQLKTEGTDPVTVLGPRP